MTGDRSEPVPAPAGSWWQRVSAGRHATLVAGAVEEAGALPVPSWGTFAGIAQGALTAVLCFVAAFPAFQDARHGFVVLMATAVGSGLAEVLVAVRLRRGAPAALAALLLTAGWSLVGDVAVTGRHELHRSLVTAVLVLLAVVTLIGAVPEWRNAERARRERLTGEDAPTAE